jgi:4-amino-4-deoxy-L-arabinose transferase-like glycosyltransferase
MLETLKFARPATAGSLAGVALNPVPPLKRTLLSLLLILLVVAAVRVPLLNLPFERDEGEYAYIAWRLEHHELPYRDWIDQKPPAIFWTYRLALSLPVEPVCAVHWLALLWSAASAGALFLLAVRFLKPFWALTAALLFALLSADPSLEGTAANTELFMLLPLLLSLPAFFSATAGGRRALGFMLLAGALTGMAAAYKQVAAVNWLMLVALYPVFAPGEHRLRRTAWFAVGSAAGAALIWGLISAYFFLRHGLADFIYNVFTHNLEYIQAIPWPDRLALCRATLSTLSPSQALVWIFAAGGLAALFAAGRTQWLLFLGGWLAASLVGVSASGYYFPHYFQQLLPVLAVAAALGAEALDDDRWGNGISVRTRRFLLGGLLAFLPLRVMLPFLFVWSPAESVRKIYPVDKFAEMRLVGERVAQITRPDDRVFIFGAEPEVLFYARRVSATRYIFLFPL